MQPTCFVIMPFGGQFDDYYREIIRPAVESSTGLQAVRADDIYSTGPIINDIVEGIRNAEMVVADVSGKNPNVNYELGLSHAFGKPAVIISQSMEDVPFDYRHLRVITYNTARVHWAGELAAQITKTIRLVRQNPTSAALWTGPAELEPAQKWELPDFQFSQGDRPSYGWVRTDDQLVYIHARAGWVGEYMLEVARQVLADVEALGSTVSAKEYLMLRELWFDDKHGGVTITVELLHDTSAEPTYTAEELQNLLHDGMGWYLGQTTSVTCKITRAWIFSDGFFPVADQFYGVGSATPA